MYYPRWWVNRMFGNPEDSLSILDLVKSGTVDCKLAGLLWTLMENRASVLVAAGPSFAGKTTLLHALLDFLPPAVNQVTLQGYYEDFRFLGLSQPAQTYLVAEEISNHGFEDYLWGLKAVRTIKLLSQGYALGATIHARNSEEVLFILHRALGITLPHLANLGVIVNLRVTAGRNYYEDEPVRRVGSVDLVLPHPEGLAIQVLAAQQNTQNGYVYPADQTLQQALAGKKLVGKDCIGAEIDTKKRFLRHLLKQGKTTRKQVRKAIQEYYGSNSK